MRLVSLDVLRGAAVIGMILVNSAAAMKFGAKAAVPPLLLHSAWQGLTPADLVFPAFLTMVGVAIPYSLRSASGGPAVWRILWRAARLFLLGSILSNLQLLQDFASGPYRIFGVLQRIGLAYAACALLFLWVPPRMRMAIIMISLIGYWPLTLLPPLDGLTGDLFRSGHNFVASIDRVVLGTHRYVQGAEGYDPEGLLGTLPAIAQGLIGVAIGEFLLRGGASRTRRLAMAGLAMIAIGFAWSGWFPIVKDIWSSTFVLVTAGIVALALAVLHHMLDHEQRAPGVFTRAAVAFGTNAIAAYTLHQATAQVVRWDLLLLPYRTAVPTFGEPIASLFPIAIYMALLWAAMEALRRKAWIIQI